MHALALYLLLVHEPQHDGKTAGALTNTQKVVFILAAVHKDLGVRENSGTYVCVFVFSVVGLCLFFPPFLFVWHVIEGERWPWSDLFHAYPQNERTVLLTFLISSLFSPLQPWGVEGGASSIQD